MPSPLNATCFVKQPQFKGKPWSVLVFIVCACIAWGINMAGQIVFPSQNLLPYVARCAIMLGTDIALLYISFRLLNQNQLPREALGLSVSKRSIAAMGWGTLIAAMSVAIMAGLLYMYIPYHFTRGPMAAPGLLKEGVFYLLGNTLEELIFRGFLFILLSQLAGWRLGALITGLLFGLFHLQGMGFNPVGWKMFASTACYSFVFSFSFVLFRSLWAAISIHVAANILLHAITGLDGANNAMFIPVFEKSWPKGYDISFTVTIISAIVISGFLLLAIARLAKKNISASRRCGTP